MTRRRLSRRNLIAALAVAAFSMRALVPAGFMPASGHLFSLELCPDGLPDEMLSAEMQHPGNPGAPHGTHPGRIEHCAFGCASVLGLFAPVPAIDLLLVRHVPPAARFTPQRTGWLLLRVVLPRGPPTAA